MTGCCDVVERYNMHMKTFGGSEQSIDASIVLQAKSRSPKSIGTKNDKYDMDDGQQDARMALHTIALMIKF